MAKSPKVQSIEPIVAQWANTQLQESGWNVKFEQEAINQEIANALKNALSKSGGEGGCRVDAQMMISNGAKQIPVFFEYKGKKGDLEELDKHSLVRLKNDKNEYEFSKVISKYAVNGAVYYANVVLNNTSYQESLAIGVNGYRDETDHIRYEVKAYILNKDNPNLAIFLYEGSDFSFLNKTNLSQLFSDIAEKQMHPDELHRKHLQDESRLDKVLKELNQHLRDESRIQVNHRIAVVTPCIMAGLGVKKDDGSYIVSPLLPEELTSSQEEGETDGDKIYRKVVSFLKARKIPDIKRKHIQDSLKATLLHQRLGLVDEKLGYSPLKSAYKEVYENIIPAYHLSGILDFTGKLFNVMNDWVAVPDGDQNDVVLTPRYVTDLMARLVEVDQNSYVWDWALGSGGFLISAMNQMLQDAKRNATSEAERLEKEQKIKSEQLLGVEKLPDIYILAVLNMILMNDGSTNIINENSLTEYNGNYAYNKKDEFPANVFLLNPPYSADGNGMIFVEKAFDKMNNGKGAVIIQDSAGTGQAAEFNQRILKNNRLLASIKMPADLFKASVQTSIYLFEIGKQHKADDWVKFIDFSNDGYTRTNRKKASNNLTDTDNARERYAELVNVVKHGITPDCIYFKEGENYLQDKILISKPFEKEQQNLTACKAKLETLSKLKKGQEESLEQKQAKLDFDKANEAFLLLKEHNGKVGCDWNFTQHKKIETKPTIADFKKTVADYLAWEVSQLLKKEGEQGK